MWECKIVSKAAIDVKFSEPLFSIYTTKRIKFRQFISSKIWQFRKSAQVIIYSISRKERITSELISYPTISYKMNSLTVF